jgi:hypothetical protein
MTARRLDYRAIFLGLALVFSASGVAGAQRSGGTWILTPNTGRPRVGVQAPPPQQTVVVSRPATYLPPQPVAFTLVPAVVMSDGSIYANFGYGYEPIVRPCANAAVVTTNGVMSPYGTVTYQPAAPTYVHPAPNPVTSPYNRPGQTTVVTTGAQSAQYTQYAQYSQQLCFSRDASGRVYAYRF